MTEHGHIMEAHLGVAPTTGRGDVHAVALVEDHTVLADLLELAIGREPDLELVGRAASAAQCQAEIAEWDPDAVLMDVRLSDGDGIALAHELRSRFPHLRIIVLTAFVDALLIRRAASAGAFALLPKDGGFEAVLHAIRTPYDVGHGQMQVHPSMMRHLLGDPETSDGSGGDLLTAREQEVLRLLATGMDARQIGHELDMSLHTCRGHVKSILRKLGAHSQLEAVATAMRRGLLHAASQA